MKAQFSVRRGGPAGGFTIAEILTVISIIAILGTLTAGAVIYAQKKAKRSKAQVQHKAIISALERYRGDFGDYPHPMGSAETEVISIAERQVPAAGSSTLYQALSGDGDDAIEGGSAAPTGKIGSKFPPYWDAVDPHTNPQRVVLDQSSRYYLVDPFTMPWQYRVPKRAASGSGRSSSSGSSSSSGGGQEDMPLHNPGSYDLWSFGDIEVTTNTNKWIKNW
jgi:type II secretory pathway pseudopilin PulG